MTALHEQVDELINEAYARKSSGNPLTPHERVQKADDLIEAYYKQTELKPPSAVLSRLAWYIVFDEMTDSHPDKVTRRETPFLSEHQEKYRQNRERSISDVYTGKNDVTVGKYRDHGGSKRRIYDYLTPVHDKALLPAKYLDLYDALENAGLTDRQRQAIELVYFEGMTQEDAGAAMGVKKNTVNEILSRSYGVLRNHLENTRTS